MCCHETNKTAYTEEVQVTSEVVETGTVAENDMKKAKDGDNVSDSSDPVEVLEETKGDDKNPSSYSSFSDKSEDEEEVCNKPPKKTDEANVKNTGGFEMYKLTDKDKGQFINKVNLHASSLTLT